MEKGKSKTDVFNEETFTYVQRFITKRAGDTRVLEVGCGTGDFALRLMKMGVSLTACDTDKTAVEQALKKGVPVKHLDFLQLENKPFDVIVFTRSLHHIHRLHQAVSHSKTLLKKGGRLIVEDFDLEMIDGPTARWYYDMRMLMAVFAKNSELNKYIEDPVKKWKEDHHHDHPLHTGKAMVQAIQDAFKLIEIKQGPYLFRSICNVLPPDETSYYITKKVLEIENGLIAKRHILPNGLRVVAEKRK